MNALRPITPLLGLLLAVGAAAACAVVVGLVLIPPQARLDTVTLLAHYEAQLRYAGGSPRPSLASRLRSRVRRRLTLAGKHDWSLHRFVLVSLATGVGGALTGMVLLGAPPFVLIGFVGAGFLPWIWLGRRAERRELTLSRQVAQMLLLIAGAGAAGLPPLRILRDVLPRAVQPPLATILADVLRRADPQRGLATVGFSDLIADLDARLESNAFSLARAALEEHTSDGADLSDSLEMIATLARLDLTFRLQVRATFATVRATAAVIFAFPLVTTMLLRLLDPGMLTAAYSAPLGWAVAGSVVSASVGAYTLATRGERRAVREAAGRVV